VLSTDENHQLGSRIHAGSLFSVAPRSLVVLREAGC